MRPHIHLTAEKIPGLRSVEEVRQAITSGHAATLWNAVRERAQEELSQQPLTPSSHIAGRPEVMARLNNPDYTICHAVGQRLLRAALVHLLTGETAYRDAAMRQMEAMFDENRWPAWCDQAHYADGQSTADLRTGALSRDIALAYDWLYSSLTQQQRETIIEGLDRRGIQPFFRALERKPSWADSLNNWMTLIVGGLGIVGMALGDDHPQSERLIEYSLPRLRNYLSAYGPDGEFNESPAYSNATAHPVEYFTAYRYWTGGGENPLVQPPFPQACRWLMYLTLPPGRVAAFGDSGVNSKPSVAHFAAIAAAGRDEVLQWFYLQHINEANQSDPRQLLYFDATLPVLSPQAKLPLGRAFPAHGGCISSRTDWNPRRAACVVYGKAGRETMHGNDDAGQLCIDGFAERLIIDLGKPDNYPADFFGPNRQQYYNASVRGHNIFMFGDREMRAGAEHGGQILEAHFDDKKGAFWQLDLTAAYEGAKLVRRTVAHLFPGIVAVLDEAELDAVEEILLRWHTANRSEPDTEGNFCVSTANAHLSGRIVRLDDGEISFSRGEHEYSAPYNRGRTGELLEQCRESYIEAKLTSSSCRLLSVFAVTAPDEKVQPWQRNSDGCSIHSTRGPIEITAGQTLRVKNTDSGQEWHLKNLYRPATD